MKTLRKAINEKDFVMLAELPMTGASRLTDIERNLARLRAHVDAVQIGGDDVDRGQPDPLVAASISLACSVDPVVHLNCRDRNRLGLRSALLGAAALGVGSVVLARGQKIPKSLRGKVKGVFDTNTGQLIRLARGIGDDRNMSAPPGFFVGAYTPVIRPKADWQAPKIEEKMTAGAQFLQTRPCLNTKLLGSFMDRLVSLKILHRVSLIVEVPLLTSVKMASAYRESGLGARIPDSLIARIDGASNPASEGVAIGAEILTELRAMPGVSGAALVVDGNVDYAIDAISRAGLSAG